MFRSLTAILALLFAASCTTRLSVDDLPPEGRRTGTADAHQFVETFNDTCMSNYPNIAQVGMALERNGFNQIRGTDLPGLGSAILVGEYWSFVNEDKGMSAFLGGGVTTTSGIFGTGGYQVQSSSCRISARLLNPEEMVVALAGIRGPSGQAVEFEHNITSDHNAIQDMARGTFSSSSGNLLNVSFTHEKEVLEANEGQPNEECNGLDRCFVWDRVFLTVGFPKP